MKKEGRIMKTRTLVTTVAILSVLLVLWAGLPAVAQSPGAGPAKLGKVNFPVSCNAAAQKEFEVAMAYYHSFAWPQLKTALDRVTQADPACGMAHCGRWSRQVRRAGRCAFPCLKPRRSRIASRWRPSRR